MVSPPLKTEQHNSTQKLLVISAHSNSFKTNANKLHAHPVKVFGKRGGVLGGERTIFTKRPKGSVPLPNRRSNGDASQLKSKPRGLNRGMSPRLFRTNNGIKNYQKLTHCSRTCNFMRLSKIYEALIKFFKNWIKPYCCHCSHV